MSKIIIAQYDGIDVAFAEDGWFNATTVASARGKRIDHWLENKETQEYIAALGRALNTRDSGDLIRTRRGRNGGTWMHPKLGVPFARWVDVDFAVWCDLQIDKILRGEQINWEILRHESKASTKVMQAMRKMDLEEQGKQPKQHHFINEARLVNFALSGEFKGMDRDAMSMEQLDKLARIEERNTLLIARGMPYDDRKTDLQKFAANWQRLPSGRGNHMLRG